mmetsp:Transcript_18499/g.33384  ORF Transcript_18499/g.33384 Transcript_18499/m.33384 type:complete len:201 (-) Transcript_18499:49-651(-)
METRRAKLNKKYESQVIISKPDGSLSQGIPTDYVSETTTERSTIDISYAVDLLQDDTVTEVVEIYCRQRNVFLALLSIQLVVEVCLTFCEVLYLNYAMDQMEEVYGTTDKTTIYLFWCVLGLFICFAVFYYGLGFYSTLSMKLRWLVIFSYLCIAGIGAQMMAVYLHKFNFILLFFRLVIYVYARYMVSLISSILLLPGY